MRHAANELNWQVEDDTEEGLQIKSQIIRHFDKEDVRTYGLCFAVQTKPLSNMFGSVIIRRQQNKNPHRLKSLERYDILYKKDFDPNAGELLLFRDSVEKDHIGTYLVSLCKKFYEQDSNNNMLQQLTMQKEELPEKNIRIIQQCKHCFTVYDELIGDEAQGVDAGTTFASLPSTYTCPLCEAPKEDFTEIEDATLIKAL